MVPILDQILQMISAGLFSHLKKLELWNRNKAKLIQTLKIIYSGLFSHLEKLELWNSYGAHFGPNLIKQLLGNCHQVF
jgi:hypothetical protein